MKPNYYSLLSVQLNTSDISVNYCTSYVNMCESLFNNINCPMNIRQVNACRNNSLNNYIGICICGNIDLSHHVADLVIDATLMESVSNNYLLIFPSSTPYTMVMATNPALQLIDPMQVVP